MTPAIPASGASAAAASVDALNISLFGFSINTPAIFIGIAILGILFLFYRIQKLEKLDFADMITKDGRTVSLTKVLQLVGGVTATWIMIKLTLSGQITEGLLGVYLMYVGAIEGYSKYVAAKHNYSETSVKDAAAADDVKPPKV